MQIIHPALMVVIALLGLLAGFAIKDARTSPDPAAIRREARAEALREAAIFARNMPRKEHGGRTFPPTQMEIAHALFALIDQEPSDGEGGA